MPDICPTAPGGLTLGRGEQPGSDYRFIIPDGSVVLDCPGRYAARLDAGRLVVRLEAVGPDACPSGGSLGFGWSSTGLAMMPLSHVDSAAPMLLPPALLGASAADWLVPGGGAGTLIWKTGPVPAQVGGFDVRLGHDTAWNDMYVTATEDRVYFRDVPLRFRPALVTALDGSALDLGTWAHGWFDAEGGGLESTIPVRLPAAKACGISLVPGQIAALSTAAGPPEYHMACRKRPAAPPDDIVIGPTWVALGWDTVPADVGPARSSASVAGGWQSDEDSGCELACKVK